MTESIEIIGLLAGFCTTFSALPQIRKIIKTKSPSDIAYLMCAMNCTGNTLWMVYGYFKDSISLLLANAIAFAFMSTIIVLKYRWDKPKL